MNFFESWTIAIVVGIVWAISFVLGFINFKHKYNKKIRLIVQCIIAFFIPYGFSIGSQLSDAFERWDWIKNISDQKVPENHWISLSISILGVEFLVFLILFFNTKDFRDMYKEFQEKRGKKNEI